MVKVVDVEINIADMKAKAIPTKSGATAWMELAKKERAAHHKAWGYIQKNKFTQNTHEPVNAFAKLCFVAGFIVMDLYFFLWVIRYSRDERLKPILKAILIGQVVPAYEKGTSAGNKTMNPNGSKSGSN